MRWRWRVRVAGCVPLLSVHEMFEPVGMRWRAPGLVDQLWPPASRTIC